MIMCTSLILLFKAPSCCMDFKVCFVGPKMLGLTVAPSPFVSRKALRKLHVTSPGIGAGRSLSSSLLAFASVSVLDFRFH